MALRDLFRARLALRIYLVGLAQIAVVAAGFFAILHANRPTGEGPHEAVARFVAGTVARELGDPLALDRALSLAHVELHAAITVTDPDGVVVGATVGEPVPPGAAPEGRGPQREARATLQARFPDGREGRIDVALRGPPPPPPVLGAYVVPLVLVVVGISSLLLARSLTRPLRRLSRAAQAFGGGDLGARVALQQRDELGDVSRAFDEMAARVTALLRAEKELLADVSHELRTPLSRIRVALDIASEGDLDVARGSLVDISGDLDELERLISDVLTAARLDLGDGTLPTGIPALRRERVDLGALLEHAASRFRAAHAERPLRVEVASSLPPIEGDPVLLRRVVDNLLENAHKYTERAADPVELVARAGDAVEIDVIDTGIGIAPADLARVFRPFFRADKSRTRATGGLGLGLALAKRIVDAHGGTIELVSAPNEGTRARVRLPIAGAPLVGG